MSAYTRMMGDYDYHKHTGELSGYFGGGNGDNRGCGFGCFVAIVLIATLIYSTCRSDKSNDDIQELDSECVTVPIYQEQTPYYPSESSDPTTSSIEEQEDISMSDESQSKQEKSETQSVELVKISQYYEEGYEKGYEDGEDDAVMGNGFGGQFDDHCRYTGWKKKEYELGYEEGYEAGYYDNKDSEE